MSTIFFVLLLLFLVIFGIDFFVEYLGNHEYYTTIFNTWVNWEIFLFALLFWLFPIAYILFTKKFSLKHFLIALWLALSLFWVAHSSIKAGIVGMSGFFMNIINTTILYTLGIYLIGSLYTLGEWLASMFIRFKQLRFQEIFINFWLGLGAFLLVNWIGIGLGIFHSVFVWALLIGGGVLLYLRKKKLISTTEHIQGVFDMLHLDKINQDPWKFVFLILILFTVIYYFLGFQLSFIPYPTAWDANHEYMYIPKVIAEYNGVLRWNIWPVSSLPYLWHSFIAFFFSLIKPISTGFWISADTVAVNMNFLSGIFVLFFGLGVLHSIQNFFTTKDTIIRKWVFVLGFSALLLWLTSGMGAFLVFVDNKTDLGVMTLTLLAILWGLVAIQYITQHILEKKKNNRESLKYLIISGVFFALAAMGKPTAFIDVVVFAVFMIARWLHSIIWAGIWIMIVGLMGILQPLNAKDFIDPILGKWLIIIGGVVTIFWIILMIIREKRQLALKVKYIRYIIVWWVAFALTLILFKTPWLVYKYHLTDTLTLPNYTKWLLFSQNTTGENTDTSSLALVSVADQQVQKDLNLTHEQCKDLKFTEEELTENLPKVEVGNEDFGRYVGYGREKFEKWSLGYYLFKVFFRKDDTCYGLNADAKLLCKNAEEIDKWNIKKLEEIEALWLLEVWGKAEQLNQKLLEEYKINPETLKYNLEKLRQYYQDHSIFTQEGIVNIPYRYIIPLNINFNRSLQNLSSYYTDIGFVRLLMLWIVVFALIYGIVTKEKLVRDIALATTIWWLIWILIAAGIVRYGVGLIMWTIVTNVVFFASLWKKIWKEQNYQYRILSTIGILLVFFAMQQVMNFLRIASQGGGEPFIRYKQSTGKERIINDSFQALEEKIFPYTADKIYDLQFGFYDPIIKHIDQRGDDESVVIAGTYMQYFLHNQRNIYFDTRLGMLANLSSDENVCKTYQRFKQKKLKYLVLDQNIWTVVMGEWNRSLFYRFFAKYDDTTKKIQEEGTISMLLKLKKYGYLDLVMTNNLGTKYAFTLPDEEFIKFFKVTQPKQIALLRAKLSVARFFHQETDLINFVGIMFQKRFNGPALQDIADMYGKEIDYTKTVAFIDAYLSQNQTKMQQLIPSLDQNEKLVTMQFIGLYNLSRTNPQHYKAELSNIIQKSLFWSTQVTAFEIN